MSKIYGYARVSTGDQTTDPQIASLISVGVPPDNIFSENISGGSKATGRPVLGALLKKLVEGDELVVARVDRLGRDPADVLTLARDLESRGIKLRLLDLGVSTLTAAGQLVLGVLAAIAGWERSIIKERTRDGLKSARSAGRIGGRRPALTPSQVLLAKRLDAEGQSLRQIARQLGGRYGTPSAETVRKAVNSPSDD